MEMHANLTCMPGTTRSFHGTSCKVYPSLGGLIARQQALLDRFRTLKKIRAASTDELSEVIGKNLALRLQDALKKRPAKKI